MMMRLQLAGIAAVGALMLLIGSYHLGKHNQRQQSAMEAAQAITKAIQNRSSINETINNMDSAALCLELGGVREQCEQLRGLATDKP